MGGEGLLGCVFGYGLLHRIPQVQDIPIQQSNDQFYDEAEVFVPADNEEYHIYGHKTGQDDPRIHTHPVAPVQNTSSSTSQNNRANKFFKEGSVSEEQGSSPHYLDPPLLSSVPSVP
ncbi:golgi reassembly-stacking [Pyrrhoderma noxium]|uniref:Golgi reassembly-stacking n=1 Tax=Pyrrhoderma noxium TaxID=2282107 RepID=A0A286UBG2_9AGAM|nr:golgi reassembly-stacking [Pyrrhoderma noxium]